MTALRPLFLVWWACRKATGGATANQWRLYMQTFWKDATRTESQRSQQLQIQAGEGQSKELQGWAPAWETAAALGGWNNWLDEKSSHRESKKFCGCFVLLLFFLIKELQSFYVSSKAQPTRIKSLEVFVKAQDLAAKRVPHILDFTFCIESKWITRQTSPSSVLHPSWQPTKKTGFNLERWNL